MRVGLVILSEGDVEGVLSGLERWSENADWLCVVDNATGDFGRLSRWNKDRASRGERRLDLLLGAPERVSEEDLLAEVLERRPVDLDWLYLSRSGGFPEPFTVRSE